MIAPRPTWLTEYTEAFSQFGQHKSYAEREERLTLQRFHRFLQQCPLPYSRQSLPGHCTASAMVISPDFEHVLLTLHAKLDLWLQLGGHADDDHDLLRVALRETEEEAGLKALRPLFPYPFDLDCHLIPAKRQDPSHFHYDIRYLVIASLDEPLVITPESKDLRWVSLAEARTLSQERSMHRQFDKVEMIKATTKVC